MQLWNQGGVLKPEDDSRPVNEADRIEAAKKNRSLKVEVYCLSLVIFVCIQDDYKSFRI